MLAELGFRAQQCGSRAHGLYLSTTPHLVIWRKKIAPVLEFLTEILDRVPSSWFSDYEIHKRVERNVLFL